MLRGPGAGLLIGTRDASADFAEGTNEVPVQEALARELSAGSTFIDIGANVGFFSLVAARLVGPGGRVVAIEAVPGIAESLADNVRRNGFDHVDVRALAVGAAPGEGTLRVASHPGGATLADDDQAPDVIATSGVEVVSLDSLLAVGLLPVPDVIKIDVEGHELPVLDGMRGLLAAYGPTLIIELDAATVDRLAAKRADLERWLIELGYQVEVLAPSYVGTDWEVVHLLAKVR